MPEDVSHLLGGNAPQEEQPQQEVSQPEVQEQVQEPEEMVRIKVRGVEKELPARLVQEWAQYTEDDPEEVRNSYQRGKDYTRVVAESRRENAALRHQLEEYQRQMAQQQAYAPPVQQPQQQKAPYDPTDPLSKLDYLTNYVPQQLDAVNKRIESFIQAQQQAQQAMAAERETQVLKNSYETWAERKKNQGFKNVPSLDEMDAMAAELELGATNLPYDRAFDIAYFHFYGDQIQQQSQKAAVDKLRDPKAKIVVPGTASAPKPPTAPSPADQLGGLTWSQGIEFLPEKR